MSLRDRVKREDDKKEPSKQPVKSTQVSNTQVNKRTESINKNLPLNKTKNTSHNSEYNQVEMKKSAIQVTASFEFAKAQYTRSLAILILGFVITAIVMLQTYYVLTYKPPVKYIPVYEDSTIIDPIPLDKPYKSEAEMRQWLADASKDIFSYDYLNVDNHGSKIKKYFTEKGYNDFMEQFQNSPDIPRVKNKKMEVISSSIGSPTKLHENYKISGNNFAYWEYKISIRQVFIAPSEGIIPVTYEMVATIVRQDQRQTRDGIAIHSFRVVSSNNIK